MPVILCVLCNIEGKASGSIQLRSKAVLFRLNPYAKTLRRQELLRQERIKKNGLKKKKGSATSKEFLENLFAP